MLRPPMVVPDFSGGGESVEGKEENLEFRVANQRKMVNNICLKKDKFPARMAE